MLGIPEGNMNKIFVMFALFREKVFYSLYIKTMVQSENIMFNMKLNVFPTVCVFDIISKRKNALSAAI